MKANHALPVPGQLKADARPCCLRHLRSFFNALRTRHHLTERARRGDLANVGTDPDEVGPTLHDLYVSELEASVHPLGAPASVAVDVTFRHDSPAELARARRVFAASWLIPLLVVTGMLVLFGDTLDRSLSELLRFSAVALAVPLAGSSAALLYRTLRRRYV